MVSTQERSGSKRKTALFSAGSGRLAEGRAVYAEDDEFEKTKAMLRLMCELNEGRRSGEEEGYISSEDVRAYFRGKRS